MTHKLSLHVEMEAAREKVKTGEWKLRKYTNRKSKVWETFAEIMKDDDQSAGFVMCTSCDAVYTFDSHKPGTTNMAMVEKEALSEVLKSAVHDNGGVAITTDMWTDDFNRRSYTALTCHYITEDWKLASRVMCTVEFDCTLPKTAINIHEQINEQLCSYGISFDQVVLVSDQGSNIKAAQKNYHWIPCAAHVLNTILKHTFSGSDIEEVTKMTDACKGIVKYLKKASASTALPHGLVQECETRWNSKIDMLKSVSKQYREINELLESRGQSERMEGIYQNTLTTVIDFLEPFKKASEELRERTTRHCI
ncbi:hypothetical protein M9458_052136 [Cirrhinus mrigala]|uniref:Uncharacterized protein n=1 Tax=Cirrhinus mrigala TaxID=683832 RepID=A0ABD0MTB2_CIRMR